MADLDRTLPAKTKDRAGVDPAEVVIAEWALERPDLDMSPMRVLHPVWMIVEELVRARTELLQHFGLTLAGIDVLAALRRVGSPYRLTPTELARVAMVTTGGMTPRLDRLEASGLIRRSPDTDDRRILYAELTASGVELADDVITAFAEREKAAVASLSPEDRSSLEVLLPKLLHAVTLANVASGAD